MFSIWSNFPIRDTTDLHGGAALDSLISPRLDTARAV